MADQMNPDELRARAKSALAEVHDQGPRRTYSVAEVKRIVYSLVDANELLADVIEHAERRGDRPSSSPYIQGARDAWRTILDIARGEIQGQEAEVSGEEATGDRVVRSASARYEIQAITDRSYDYSGELLEGRWETISYHNELPDAQEALTRATLEHGDAKIIERASLP